MASQETVQCPVSSTTSGLTSRNNEQSTQEEIGSIGDPDCYNSLNDYSYLNGWKDLVNTSSKDLYVTDLQVNKQWQDINGKGVEKWFLNEAVYCPIQFPELYKTLPVPWKGILLFGPSGSRKTTLIKALANQCQNATFFNVSFTNTDKSLRTKLIRTVFEFTKYHAFSIVCLHKIEQYISAQQDEREKLSGGDKKCELLKIIDEIYATNEHVFLFATSNSPWNIDPEILSRFEKYISCDKIGDYSSHFYNSLKYIEWEKKYREKFL
ncbi:katanin p60 ATPase-containing subunit A-like 2 [Chrysoperla carnea]|uniref:katanin p60 ATPase-containing subunit A-like 2 n=1 Tax=Chrysoperla carnea TaxID=189513 RepID=UPI001D083E23|nr:katanin p60 ATPase-containing subunit A-like 2 [Chrysoperla carnea]